MKRSIIITLAIGFLALFGINDTFAQDLSAREIVQKNDQQRKADDEQVELTMKLINKKGKERIRKVTQVTRTEADDNQKFLIRFQSPADVKGTGLLTIEHTERDDDQWLYLPALKKVRRISASNQSDNFMGSDFAYEDLGSEEMENYDYKLLKEETLEGTECYLIEAVPGNDKEKKDSGYSKREMWIRKDNFVAIQIKYYDKKNELLKVLKSTDIQLIEGTEKWRAHHLDMKNLKTKHKTILLFENYVINEGVEDKFFTQRYLERGK